MHENPVVDDDAAERERERASEREGERRKLRKEEKEEWQIDRERESFFSRSRSRSLTWCACSTSSDGKLTTSQFDIVAAPLVSPSTSLSLFLFFFRNFCFSLVSVQDVIYPIPFIMTFSLISCPSFVLFSAFFSSVKLTSWKYAPLIGSASG